MTNSLMYYLDAFWQENGHPGTRNMPLTQIPFYYLFVLIFIYFVGIRISALMHSKLRWNIAPIAIPYYGFYFGCYFVGVLVALFVTQGGRNLLSCGPFKDAFTDMLVSYLSFLFCTFQIAHVCDTWILKAAGQEHLVSNAHIIERVFLIFRAYIDLKFFPNGVGASSAILVSSLAAINYSYLIRHFASTELRPSSSWSDRVKFLRVIGYFVLVVHGLYSLTILNCASPYLVRLSQLITYVILFLAFSKELFFQSKCSKQKTAKKFH